MRLSRVNTILLVAIILINAVVFLMPFWPALAYDWEDKTTNRREEMQQVLQETSSPPTENTLVIPSMLLDQPIHEGSSEKTLSKGLWLRPNSSTPDKGGNTVIVAHRFTYTNPRGTFYLLDKVKVGDEIGVFWQGKRYLYKVQSTAVIPQDARHIEAPTEAPTLTLYTCTPLWNPNDRLVVTATLREEQAE